MPSSALLCLASDDLLVFTANDDKEEFRSAIVSRAYNGRLPNPSAFPLAVLQVKSVSAVQKAVRYCRNHQIRICVRSGGHSWEATWLQGEGTVLLDVGDLKHIEVDADSKSIRVGPGAASDAVLEAALAHDLHFPCGHCQNVPVGGFLLGGGYGIGYTKYGLSCTLIQEMDVVMADGSLVQARADSDNPKEQALLHLAMGSYAAFPGVITQFKLGPLPARPTVYRGSVVYSLENWEKALEFGRATSKNRPIETTIILTYAPPPILEATGVSMVAIVALDIYAENGVELWQMQTSKIPAEDLLVPLDPKAPKAYSPKDIPNSTPYSPGARFQTQVYVDQDNLLHDNRDGDLKDCLKPLLDMWLSPDSSNKPPAPRSHTLLVCPPPKIPKSDRFAGGFRPGLGVMSYAIYFEETQDDAFGQTMAQAHSELAQSNHFRTSLVEGALRRNGAASGFTREAHQKVQDYVRLLDPNSVFAGFPNKEDEEN